MFGHVLGQFRQRRESPVAASASVRPLFLELLMSEAVVVVFLFMLETFQAARALVRPFVDMSAQVVLECIQFDENQVAMWTPVLPLLMNRHMPLVMGLFLEELVTLGAIIKAIRVRFLVLL